MEGMVVGYCFTCKSRLTVDDLFEHSKEHKIEKVQKIKDIALKELENFLANEQKTQKETPGTQDDIKKARNEAEESLKKFFKQLEEAAGVKHAKENKGGASSKEALKSQLEKLKTSKAPCDILDVIENQQVSTVLSFSSGSKHGESEGSGSGEGNGRIYHSQLHSLLFQSNLKSLATVSSLDESFKITSTTAISQIVFPVENSSLVWLASAETKEISNIELDGFLVPYFVRTAVISNTSFLLLGGVENGETLNQVVSIDARSSEIKTCAPMKTAKIGFGVCVVAEVKGASVYIFGGRSQEGVRLNSVEKYSVKNNSWESVCNMTCVRSGSGACLFGRSHIYVFGGVSASGAPEKTIERLVIATGKIEKLSLVHDLYSPLIDPQAVQINENEIAVLGGSEMLMLGKQPEILCTKTILKFNPKKNDILNMNVCDKRLPVEMTVSESIAVHGGKIFSFAKIKKDTGKTFTNPLIAQLTIDSEEASLENLF